MRKILVLDDDQVILDLLQTVLADAGYETFLASSLSQVPEGTSADVVITDLIPLKAYRRDTAVEWVASLRSRFVRSPILVVTAHAAALAEADKLGANAIIAKPFDVEVLLATLDELLPSCRRRSARPRSARAARRRARERATCVYRADR